MRASAFSPFRWIVLLLLTVSVVAAVRATAPDLRISGRVVDRADGRPLAAARVSVPALGIATLTDAEGRYVLRIPASRAGAELVAVRVDLMGYGSASATARVPGGAAGEVTLDFALDASAPALEQVVTDEAEAGRVGRDAAPPALPAASAALAAVGPRGGVPWRTHPGEGEWNREQYGHIEENDFKSVADRPLSTFSVDVDRASYANLRRFLLRERRLPPVDAVQIEEMVNYFAYGYDLPRGRDPVAVTTELGAAPWRPGHRLLRIGLAARPIEVDQLPPSNLVFLLDVSGSMAAPDKLPLVKSSMRLLVDQLRPQDHVAIVVYAGAAGLVLEPTSGAHKERIVEALERLRAGGSTAGGAGLRLAYDVARRHFRADGNNRVILATDGDFNVGESSDGAMIRLIEDRRREGTYLTVLGFGTGNLQNEKMQSIAQHGNGNYGYIDSLDEARKTLVGEMGSTLVAVARDVKIQVEFNPAVVRAYRLLGYENRLLADEDFNDDTKDAGEMGAGHTVTALYEVVPVDAESPVGSSGIDPLRYQAPRDPAVVPSNELAFVRVRYKEPDGERSRLLERPVENRVGAASPDLTFAAAVAGFGMLLRESEHRGTVTAEGVRALALDGLGDDPHGYRRGFLELVDAYRSLAVGTDGDGME